VTLFADAEVERWRWRWRRRAQVIAEGVMRGRRGVHGVLMERPALEKLGRGVGRRRR
jgi:hypothetical protein